MFSPDSLFARFMNVLADVLLIGILWLLCSLPLLTVTSSSTAAYYAMSKCVRHKTGYILQEFFRCFKRNARQSLVMGAVFWGVMLLLGFDLYYAWNANGSFYQTLTIVLIGIAFLYLCVMLYYGPLLSRFERTNLQLLKMSGLTAFRFFPYTLLTLVVTAGCLLLTYLLPWMILVAPGVFWFYFSFPMERIFRRIMPVPEPDSEEAKKWYYQWPEAQEKGTGGSFGWRPWWRNPDKKKEADRDMGRLRK